MIICRKYDFYSFTVSFLQTNWENVEESEGGKKYSFVWPFWPSEKCPLKLRWSTGCPR